MNREKIITAARLAAASVIIGTLCGAGGSFFHFCTEKANEFRILHPWLIFFLPVSGLAIVGLYKLCKIPPSTNSGPVFEGSRKGTKVNPLLSVCIFFATCLTHLFGGSAGREGAALQFGGSLGSAAGSLFRFDRKNNRMAVLCGMAAGFTAMFGTPLAAAVFAVEATDLVFGLFYTGSFIYIIISVAIAFAIASATGAHGMRFQVETVSWSAANVLKLALIAAACAAVALLFIYGNKYLKAFACKYIKNDYIRIFIGGLILIVLSLIWRSGDYNGVGSSVISAAMAGEVKPEAFLLKLIFTVITLSFGYKGGELVPIFFIGATLGGALGGLLGLPVAFCAAVGMIAIFSAAADCPLTAIVMGAEIFGVEMLPFFLLVCIVSYFISGNTDFYNKKTYRPEDLIFDQPTR